MTERFWRRALALALLALAWQSLALWLDHPFFPSLSETLLALRDAVLSEDQLLAYVRETLLLLAVGTALGTFGALALLVVAAVSPLAGASIALVAVAPAIALYPLATLWLGEGLRALVFLTALAVALSVANTGRRALRETPPVLVDFGRNLGLGGFGLFLRILLPSILPSLAAGLRRGVGGAFVTLLAAELLLGQGPGTGGLGWFLLLQKRNHEIPTVFAGVLLIFLLALLLDLLFGLVEEAACRRGKPSG